MNNNTQGGILHYYTIDYCHVIQFFDSPEKKCFSRPTLPYFCRLSSAAVVVFAVSFLSALTFAGRELEKQLFSLQFWLSIAK